MDFKDAPRPSWSRHLEFVITCIGFAVGLGNVWRFPYLCFRNGGGAFLIPYTISLFFMGIPLFGLEIAFGQFASLGPLSIWTINPLFKGLGYTMMALVAVLSIYYNVVVAQAIYFFFASMQATLPWTQCGNDWNTCYCRTGSENDTALDPLRWYNSSGLNCTGITVIASDIKSASEEYYNNYVLEKTSGIDEPGKLKWDMTLCNLLAWVIICASLIKGVKTLGKVAYFFALFPYVLLTVLLVRGVTLEGSRDGIYYYLVPDIEKLKDSQVWMDAAAQIFFSLSTSTGSLTAMSSYNKFKNNSLRDSIVIPIINCLTSFYAGFAIFSVLGYMAKTKNVAVADVTESGPGLVFVAYPEALAKMPVPQLWSILFFFMMVCLGMGTQIPSVETLLTAFQDEYAVLRGKWTAIFFRISVCVLGFLLGLPQTTQGGTYLLDLMDIFVGFPLLLVGLFEFISIVWVYGFRRLSEDMMMMFGDHVITRYLYYGYFSWTWLIVAPGFILAIIVFNCIEYVPVTGPGYPEWAEALGWLTVAFIMMWIPVWYIGAYCYYGGFRKLVELNQPLPQWGPRLMEHRTIPRYQLAHPVDLNHVQPEVSPYASSYVHSRADEPPTYNDVQIPATSGPPHYSGQNAATNGPPVFIHGKQHFDNPAFDAKDEKMSMKL